MPIVPAGSTNLSAISVPNVYVAVKEPDPLLNGVPTNIVGVVGKGSWGPVNAPTSIGSMQDQTSAFGIPENSTHDMGTQVYNAIQQGSNRFVCVRVTDGTDEKSSVAILDTDDGEGAILTAKYSGTKGNNLTAVLAPGSGSTDDAPTYKLSIFFSGSVPEVFDNIGGAGTAFWSNLVNAINLGQNNLRGPSQICTAVTQNYISSVSITAPGSYRTLPTFGTTGSGSGAVLIGHMQATPPSPAAIGSGYVQGDTITLTGGTHTINTVFTVVNTQLNTLAVNNGGSNYEVGDEIILAGGTFVAGNPGVIVVTEVDDGEITDFDFSHRGAYTVNTATFTQSATTGAGTGATFNTATWGVALVSVSTPGSYTALPSNPVSQGSTSGSGTGAAFTCFWSVLAVSIDAEGSGFDETSALSITGGGGSGAIGVLNLGSAGTPQPDTYNFTGGTNGNQGVTDITLIGNDTDRSGMYALRSTGAGIAVLSEQTNPTYWTDQVTFGLSEGIYMIGVMAANYYSDIDAAIAVKQTAAVNSYTFKLMLGDWIYFNDPFNQITRLVSPQGFIAGVLGAISPSGSSLNKPMRGVVATQKSSEKQVYSDGQLAALYTAGIDVITKPIPASPNSFGGRIGLNTSGNITTNGDNYPRMIYFLAKTVELGMGRFIGNTQTPDEQRLAKNTVETFLQNLVSIGMIGTIDGSPAFRVILDVNNNPPERVALGFMTIDVQVTLFSIIQNLVVNLQAGQSVQIEVLPPRTV